MHHSELEGQSREHTSQDVPHPCHFQRRHFQELPDVCVEALEDQANRTFQPRRPKKYDVHEFDNVGVARQRDVAPRFGIGVFRLF